MYEVAVHRYGRKLITRDGPTRGLLEWPQHVWVRITPRPIGLARAKALANAQDTHATVQIWMSADKVYDNDKPALVPDGWYQADTQFVHGVNRP